MITADGSFESSTGTRSREHETANRSAVVSMLQKLTPAKRRGRATAKPLTALLVARQARRPVGDLLARLRNSGDGEIHLELDDGATKKLGPRNVVIQNDTRQA